MAKSVPVFKAGQHRGMEFDIADLDRIIDNFQEEGSPRTIVSLGQMVVGHVNDLFRKPGKSSLRVDIKFISQDIADMIEKRRPEYSVILMHTPPLKDWRLTSVVMICNHSENWPWLVDIY